LGKSFLFCTGALSPSNLIAFLGIKAQFGVGALHSYSV